MASARPVFFSLSLSQVFPNPWPGSLLRCEFAVGEGVRGSLETLRCLPSFLLACLNVKA